MADWDYTTDFLVVGSGAGVVGALRARALGEDVLVVEKSDLFGGATCMSGGGAGGPAPGPRPPPRLYRRRDRHGRLPRSGGTAVPALRRVQRLLRRSPGL